MPSLANGNSTANGAPKFQLPALDLQFGSLTEGTNIPPPLPSPIEEEPSETTSTAAASPTTTNANQSSTPEALRNGVKRPSNAGAPGSPVSSKAPASIRRLFSRNRLNETYYANLDSRTEEAFHPRPASQSNASIATESQSRRASGWFRRLRGSDGMEIKRSSRVFFSADKSDAPISTGPPPPKLPEFKALAVDGGSLGTDLFKDIK